MDYNWFLSALAQSAAAIIGVIGAFLISMIIGKETSFRKLNNDINELLIQIDSQIIKLANIDFSKYNDRENHKAISKQEFNKAFDFLSRDRIDEIEKIRYQYGFSLFDSKENFEIIISDLIEKRKRRKEEMKKSDAKREALKSIGLGNFLGVMESTAKQFDERYEVNGVVSDIYGESIYMDNDKNMIRMELNNTITISKKCEYVVSRIIEIAADIKFINKIIDFSLVFFILGVVYPLSLMPIEGELIFCEFNEIFGCIVKTWFTFKGFILTIVTIMYYYLIRTFRKKIEKLSIDSNKISKITKYESYGEFSAYIRNYRNNIRSLEKKGINVEEGYL